LYWANAQSSFMDFNHIRASSTVSKNTWWIRDDL
jgi:hypothetical protein